MILLRSSMKINPYSKYRGFYSTLLSLGYIQSTPNTVGPLTSGSLEGTGLVVYAHLPALLWKKAEGTEEETDGISSQSPLSHCVTPNKPLYLCEHLRFALQNGEVCREKSVNLEKHLVGMWHQQITILLPILLKSRRTRIHDS